MFRQKNLSKDFITKIVEKAAGKVRPAILDDFFSNLEKEIENHYFTKLSESNLLRIILNQFDIAFYINQCIKFPHHIEVLFYLANNSNYLTDILVRNPEYFHWITNPSVLEFKVEEKYFNDSLLNLIAPFKSFESKVNATRNFKRKEILRIGLKDIYLKEDLIRITSYLSQLAVSISSVLFDLCYKEILKKYSLEKVSNKYVLVSLGKLGGNELNYSSDIDLIAFYDKNTLINKKIYYQQILSETILLFVETSSKKTGAGFLYRVDFRLRPDGRNSQLCASYTEYLRYYEMRGEDWERQMLIKANFLCGSKSLYTKFTDYLSKFIYPASFTTSPLDQIRRLKLSIEKKNKSDENIKLTSGGIRDIEFSVQALQLISGGKDNAIRTGNSLIACKVLLDKNILNKDEYEILTKAYIFYRKAEHYLQLMNDQQTHNIPVEGEIAEKLSHYSGCKELKSFNRLLNDYKQKVRMVYISIVGSEPEIEDTKSDFDKIKFSDIKRAKSNLEFLRTGKSILEKKQFDSRTTISFEKLEERIISFLIASINPDLVLENFVRIIKSAQFPQIWYDELNDEKFLKLTMQLCERSQKAVDIFSEDKFLRDEYLSRDSLLPLKNINSVSLSLKQFYFRSAIQLTAKILSPEDFSFIYSEFLDSNISNFTEQFTIDQKWKNNFFIAAMGSYGSKEVSFASDIDLIFVVNEISNYPSIQNDFQNLLQTIRNNFAGLDVDCRLRPEGKSSQLVWDINEYKKYLLIRARVWELQAYTKVRLIYGNSDLFNEFMSVYYDVVKTKDDKQIKSEMAEMRKKLLPINDGSFNIKKSSGGLYDIDFIKSFIKLTQLKISGLNLNFEELENNFIFLKQIELLNQNIFNTKISKVPTDEIKLLKLSRECGFENNKSFLHKLNEVIQQNKILYQNIFK